MVVVPQECGKRLPAFRYGLFEQLVYSLFDHLKLRVGSTKPYKGPLTLLSTFVKIGLCPGKRVLVIVEMVPVFVFRIDNSTYVQEFGEGGYALRRRCNGAGQLCWRG